jgi:SH3-like domain-containing protein
VTFLRSLLLFFACSVWAETPPLQAPRFATLKNDEVNVRVGPGEHFPIQFVFNKAHLPVQIIREFEKDWKQVKDHLGSVGWVHKRMLTGKKWVLVRKQGVLRKGKEAKSKPLAKLEAGVICPFKKCEDGYCKLTLKTPALTGWFPQENLWGVE